MLRYGLLFSVQRFKMDWIVLGAALLICCMFSARVSEAGVSPLEEARQLVVVVADEWSSVPAVLQRYERGTGTASWRPVGKRIQVSLGRSGQGWGIGLHPEEARRSGELEKREGDGRAPTGVFELVSCFAYAPEELAGTAMPVLKADSELVCVDDSSSRYYNEVFPGNVPDKDWNSAEDMLRKDGLYRYGVVVAHNQNPPLPGRGSCIFLHVERSPGASTAGCTAMKQSAVKELILWLDPAAKPMLAQFPKDVYERLKEEWAMP